MSNQQTSEQHASENNTFQIESIVLKKGGIPSVINSETDSKKYIYIPRIDEEATRKSMFEQFKKLDEEILLIKQLYENIKSS